MEFKTITGPDVANLEEMYGEWCIDIADLSIALSEKYAKNLTIRNLFIKMMDEKFPDIVELCKTIADEDQSPYDEELIHELQCDNTITDEKFYDVMAEVYNLNDKTNALFWRFHNEE